MSDVMLASVGLAALNTLLALAVGAVYLRNHREIRSPFTLGLVLFALFLVLHNGTQVYHFFTMMSVPWPSEGLVLAENLLQALALGALAVATLR